MSRLVKRRLKLLYRITGREKVRYMVAVSDEVSQNALWGERSFQAVQGIFTTVLFIAGGLGIYGTILAQSFPFTMSIAISLFINIIIYIYIKKESYWAEIISILSLAFYSMSLVVLFPYEPFFHLAPAIVAVLLILYLEKWPFLLYLFTIEVAYFSVWNYSEPGGEIENMAFHYFYPAFYASFIIILAYTARQIRLLLGFYEIMKEDELSSKVSEYIKSYEIPYLMFMKTISDQMAQQAINIEETSSESVTRVYNQKNKLSNVLELSSTMKERFLETFDIVKQTTSIINDTLEMAEQGKENVDKILEMVTKMVKIVDITQKSINDLSMATKKVEGVIQVIDKIANQTRLLALNASIEAARLRERESGFLMVATEVKELASLTQVSVQNISSTVREIKRKTHAVQEIIRQEAVESLKGLDIARLGGQSIQYVVSILTSIKGEIEHIHDEFISNEEMAVGITGNFEQIHKFVDENESRMSQLRKLAGDMKNHAGHILDLIEVDNISEAITDQNDRAYMLLNRFSIECERVFEEAIIKGEITEAELFDRSYHPIEDQLEKFDSKYDTLFEQKIKPKLDDYLQLDDHFIYFYMLDDQGYAPVHNSIYSQELSGNEEIDIKVSRHKRIFQDYPTKAAIKNEEIYLLQCVLGNTGEPIMDMSVTLHFHDRKWGIVRVGYVYE